MSDHSAPRRICLNRVPRPHEGALSGVLTLREMGYLTIKVQFHRVPEQGLTVRFFVSKNGQQVGADLRTDEHGVVRVPRVVPAGLYHCEIERQTPTLVPTVQDLAHPYPVVLPVGRPYVDINERYEFEA
jgi:hypothetical protein